MKTTFSWIFANLAAKEPRPPPALFLLAAAAECTSAPSAASAAAGMTLYACDGWVRRLVDGHCWRCCGGGHLAVSLSSSSASSVIPVTVVFLPGVLVLAMPPFFTDLLADFLEEVAFGVALVLGVTDFFAEPALGVFFAEPFGVFLADALGVAALAAAGAGESSSLWRLLDFCADCGAGEASRFVALACLGAFFVEAALGVAAFAAADGAALGVADALAGVAAFAGVDGCFASICEISSADLAFCLSPSSFAMCCSSLRSSAPKLSAECFGIQFAVVSCTYRLQSIEHSCPFPAHSRAHVRAPH